MFEWFNVRDFKAKAEKRSAWIPIGIIVLLAIVTGVAVPAMAEVTDGVSEDESVEVIGADSEDESVEVTDGVSEEDAIEVDEEKFQGVEKMTVEARRRSESMQEIGESVSSFSAADLEARGLTNFNDLQYNVPSLFSGGGLTKITLRGVGSEVVGPGIDPGFAVHVNGVYSARESTGLINYYDIERVDVLRGPQGTLWGRNSTGGAVNIVTKRAVHEFGAEGDIDYGWFDSGSDGMLARGVLNMPMVEDTLSLRVAGLFNFADGQMEIKSEDFSQDIDDAAAATLRASLRWDPTEDVTVDLIGSWLQTNGAGPGRKFQGDYFNTPGNYSAGAGAGNDYTGALANPNDPYKGSGNEPQRSDATVWTATLLVAWELENLKFDSITGYQSTDFFIHLDADTSSLDIQVLELTDRSRQISQEFLVNSTWDRSVNYTIGTIYQYDWTPETLVDSYNGQNTQVAQGYRLVAGLPDSPLVPGGLSLVDGCPPPDINFVFAPSCPPEKIAGDPYEDFIHALAEVENHVFGLYGNFDWEVIEDLTLSAGGRYSYTYRDWNDSTVAQTFAFLTQFNPLFPPNGLQILQVGVDQSEDWMSGTWKVGVEYELTDVNLLWASVGTGSRAGGFNFAEESSFNAERILAYEAGIKNTFFDNRLILNITGFYYDWKDPQIGATENALPVVKNVPTATSYGVELDWLAAPIDNVLLNGSFGWLEAFYDSNFYDGDVTIQDFSQRNPVDRVTIINLDGNRLPRSPRFTISLGAEYRHDIGRFGSLSPRVDCYYRDEVAFRQYGNSKDTAPGYTRTDVRITWRSESEHFWAEAYARNLENEAVKTNQEIAASVYRVHSIDDPLSGGIRVGYVY